MGKGFITMMPDVDSAGDGLANGSNQAVQHYAFMEWWRDYSRMLEAGFELVLCVTSLMPRRRISLTPLS